MILDYLITNDKGSPAQVGYDLTVSNINLICGGILSKDKSEVLPYKEVEFSKVNNSWVLMRGMYSLTFEQGIKLDDKHTAFIIHRSSVSRMGSFITSAIYDPGFEVEQCGATMNVMSPIRIEKGARIAQLYIMENYKAEKYNGQWFGPADLK